MNPMNENFQHLAQSLNQQSIAEKLQNDTLVHSSFLVKGGQGGGESDHVQSVLPSNTHSLAFHSQQAADAKQQIVRQIEAAIQQAVQDSASTTSSGLNMPISSPTLQSLTSLLSKQIG